MISITPISIASNGDEKYIGLSVANSTHVDLSKYNKPMTKAEFYKVNAEYIKFLEEQLGKETAKRLADEEYLSSQGDAKSSVSAVMMSATDNTQQIYSYQMYLWGWINSASNTNGHTGPVNIVFLNRNKGQIEHELIFHTTSSPGQTDGDWYGSGQGWNEYALHGSSPTSMTWSSANMFTNDQLYNGGFFTNRYHMLVFDGGHDSLNNIDWSYGSSHHEHFDLLAAKHYIDSNGWDTGRDYAMNSVKDHLSYNWYSDYILNNEWPGYFNGVSKVVYMGYYSPN